MSLDTHSVWDLAAKADQPLALTIFYAVAYGAWDPTGEITLEFAQTLEGVLPSAMPGDRPVSALLHPAAPAADPAGSRDVMEPEVLDERGLAAAALADLGKPLDAPKEITEVFVLAGLGDLDAEGRFVARPTRARHLRAVADGSIPVEDLL